MPEITLPEITIVGDPDFQPQTPEEWFTEGFTTTDLIETAGHGDAVALAFALRAIDDRHHHAGRLLAIVTHRACFASTPSTIWRAMG